MIEEKSLRFGMLPALLNQIYCAPDKELVWVGNFIARNINETPEFFVMLYKSLHCTLKYIKKKFLYISLRCSNFLSPGYSYCIFIYRPRT